MRWRSVLAFAMGAIGCGDSSSTPPNKAAPPSFVVVTAPDHVALMASIECGDAGSCYLWKVGYTYSDSDDSVTQLQMNLANHGSGTSVASTPVAAQIGALSQFFDVPFPVSSKGKTYDYTFVLTDQSGLQSAPYSGTVTFD